MLAELLQPMHLILLGAIFILLFGGRWFANLGIAFRDAVRNFRTSRLPKRN